MVRSLVVVLPLKDARIIGLAAPGSKCDRWPAAHAERAVRRAAV